MEQRESVFGKIPIKRRYQLATWVRLIVYEGGHIALWQGANRVELPNHDAVCLMYALIAELQDKKEQSDEEAYKAAKQDEAGYRAFLDDVVDDEEYNAWLEHKATPTEY